MFGVLLHNSLNMSPTPHLFLNLEFALGQSLTNAVDGGFTDQQRNHTIVQFGARMGYRF